MWWLHCCSSSRPALFYRDCLLFSRAICRILWLTKKDSPGQWRLVSVKTVNTHTQRLDGGLFDVPSFHKICIIHYMLEMIYYLVKNHKTVWKYSYNLTSVKIPTYQDHSMPHSRVVKHNGHLLPLQLCLLHTALQLLKDISYPRR